MLNQILYVVRNMILFDFTEREVKEFSNKFVKMLKQDDKFLKDVYVSVPIFRKVLTMPSRRRPSTSLRKLPASSFRKLLGYPSESETESDILFYHNLFM